jgi:hypothetical protein
MWGIFKVGTKGALVEVDDDQAAAMAIKIPQSHFSALRGSVDPNGAGFWASGRLSHRSNLQLVGGDTVLDHLTQKRQW